mgnify:CR=1 FL=1
MYVCLLIGTNIKFTENGISRFSFVLFVVKILIHLHSSNYFCFLFLREDEKKSEMPS